MHAYSHIHKEGPSQPITNSMTQSLWEVNIFMCTITCSQAGNFLIQKEYMSGRFRGEKLNGISGRQPSRRVEMFRCFRDWLCSHLQGGDKVSLWNVQLSTRWRSCLPEMSFNLSPRNLQDIYFLCSKKLPAFYGTEMSSPGSQKFVDYSYPQAEEPSLCPPILFFTISFNNNLPPPAKWRW